MIGNCAAERLRAGDVAIGTMVRIPCPETIDILRQQPFDFLLLDMEHGAFSLDTLRRMLFPLGPSTVAPIVRVPENNRTVIGQVLDLGAAGVVVPHVESADDAARAVRAARYPPLGDRGICFGLRPQDYGAADPDAYVELANRSILVVLMIESMAAASRIDEILAVPGIDVILIGRLDLAYSMGLRAPLPPSDPRYAAAIRRVESAVLASPVALGAGVSDGVQAEERMKAGARFLHLQSDQALFSRAVSGAAETLATTRARAR
jgi:2-keto-3-deoxy-L-rhamnonate aldolase RhmA